VAEPAAVPEPGAVDGRGGEAGCVEKTGGEAREPAHFPLQTDCNPRAERTAAGRYWKSSLLRGKRGL